MKKVKAYCSYEVDCPECGYMQILKDEDFDLCGHLQANIKCDHCGNEYIATRED